MTDDVLEPIAWLIGTWRGGGTGTWPTSGAFAYEEEIRIELGGGGDEFPFLAHVERAWDASTGVTIHAERGFWRVHDGDAVDLTLAHPIGATEIAEGAVDRDEIRLTSDRIGVASDGLPVLALRRRYRRDGDRLRYEIDLASGDVAMMRHIDGELGRT